MNTMSDSVRRSKIYRELYPDELMMSAFGTLTPSLTERNEYFFKNWMNWADHSLRLPRNISKQYVNKICKNLGYRDQWDYQARGATVRFSSAEQLAFFKLSASDVKWS